jgi:transposase
METTMRKPTKRYSPEFKKRAIELGQAPNRSVREVAAELGVPQQTLNEWIAKTEGESTVVKVVETADEELKRLRRENERLQMECDFLKKTAAYFAKDPLK